MGLGTPGFNFLFSNSFLTRHSKAYLIGEIYYNQVTHPGYDYELAKNPPNRI
jgi:hypothetical protein